MMTHQGTITNPVQPTDSDILCGRGKAYANHPGNVRFTRTIQSNLQKYRDASKRIDRSIILASLVDQFFDQGIRFLKKNKATNDWFELSADQCHEKVGHAIRDLNRKTEATLITSANPLQSVSERSELPDKDANDIIETKGSTALARLLQCVLAEEEGEYSNSLPEIPPQLHRSSMSMNFEMDSVNMHSVGSFSFQSSVNFNNFSSRHDLTMEGSLRDFRF